ncbi:MAG: hypothetical protein GF317_08985 [Candidatus Lokiarchaeota archaeon]|nr:hypothetical protein [Candidatus Lokiarchaeota archaeon]MBD3199846.1 hypothetical protein [Candidatus Lokiarchaeota archaeon]
MEHLWLFSYQFPVLGFSIIDCTNLKFLSSLDYLILAYTKDGNLLGLDDDGRLLFKKDITQNSPLYSINIISKETDNSLLILTGGFDGVLRAYKFTSKTHLKLIWTHKFEASISGIVSEDINHDESKEILVYSLDKSLRVLNQRDGSLIWGQLFEKGIEDTFVWSNLQNPAETEIIAVGNDGTLRVFSGNSGKLEWFKKFENKIRCVELIDSHETQIIICGGDDRKLHFIDKNTHKEIKQIKFKDYVWNLQRVDTTSDSISNSFLMSTYSFDYLYSEDSLQEINFSSLLTLFNSNLQKEWEIEGYNIETLDINKISNRLTTTIGTTKGELCIIDSETGFILSQITHAACINKVNLFINKKKDTQILLCCDDHGIINAYKIKR